MVYCDVQAGSMCKRSSTVSHWENQGLGSSIGRSATLSGTLSPMTCRRLDWLKSVSHAHGFSWYGSVGSCSDGDESTHRYMSRFELVHLLVCIFPPRCQKHHGGFGQCPFVVLCPAIQVNDALLAILRFRFAGAAAARRDERTKAH